MNLQRWRLCSESSCREPHGGDADGLFGAGRSLLNDGEMKFPINLLEYIPLDIYDYVILYMAAGIIHSCCIQNRNIICFFEGEISF